MGVALAYLTAFLGVLYSPKSSFDFLFLPQNGHSVHVTELLLYPVSIQAHILMEKCEKIFRL